ncbi:MAG: AtpZ/AtpI family protein [Nitrospirae bacterium]|nr:AtpZ/AtpI family protein [Nitrospirota bacterium]
MSFSKKSASGGKEKKEFLRLLLVVSTVGINLVVATFIGLAIGYYLDKLFGTSPWLTIIFLIIGIAAGFRNLFRVALKERNNGNSEKGR